MKAGLFLAAWFTCSVVLVGAWAMWAEFRRRARSPFGPIRSGLVLPMPLGELPCQCGICTGPDVA